MNNITFLNSFKEIKTGFFHRAVPVFYARTCWDRSYIKKGLKVNKLKSQQIVPKKTF